MKIPSLILLCITNLTVTNQALKNSLPDPSLYTVSKTISLGTYIPEDITKFNGISVSKRILPDLQRLLKAADKDGLKLKVVSGYRSYIQQQTTFKSWTTKELQRHPSWTQAQAEQEANTYSAKPGHSEHQLGTTVDILSSENNYHFSADPKLKYVAWLEKNSSKYNFKISYPKTQTEYTYEPWHLRWHPH